MYYYIFVVDPQRVVNTPPPNVFSFEKLSEKYWPSFVEMSGGRKQSWLQPKTTIFYS